MKIRVYVDLDIQENLNEISDSVESVLYNLTSESPEIPDPAVAIATLVRELMVEQIQWYKLTKWEMTDVTYGLLE